MRKVAAIIALFVAWEAAGQLKKVESYELESGQVIEIGDIITLGEPSGVNGSYQYVYTKPSVIGPGTYPLGPGYKGGYFEIIEIQQPKNPLPGVSSSSVIFKMGKQKMMAGIDQGLESGEFTISKP